MQKLNGRESEAEFPPQICCPGLPAKIRVARGVAQVDVLYLRGGVEGCCTAHYIVHPQCPRLVARLLHLVVGDGEGLVPRQGVGSRFGAALRGGELRQRFAGTWSQEVATKGFESCEKAKQWKLGQIHVKFIENWYEFRADFTASCICEPSVNLCVNLGA